MKKFYVLTGAKIGSLILLTKYFADFLQVLSPIRVEMSCPHSYQGSGRHVQRSADLSQSMVTK